MVWRVVILVALGLVNLVLFVHMLWGGTGLMEYADLRRQLREAQEQVAELDRKNVELSNEIRWLQSDSQYLEKMILPPNAATQCLLGLSCYYPEVRF